MMLISLVEDFTWMYSVQGNYTTYEPYEHKFEHKGV